MTGVQEQSANIMAKSGQDITFAALDRLSNQVAKFLHANGVGDKIAICLNNHPFYLVLAWGAQRAGTFMTTCPRAWASVGSNMPD
jgi:acyl-CoA synthetase (AMP-forming)/AMP-acid ligase II